MPAATSAIMKNTVSVLYFSASAERLVRVVMAVSPEASGASARLLLQRLHLLAGLELVDARGGDQLAVLHARGDGGGVVAPARDRDGAERDGAAFLVDDPDGGLRAALEDRRQGHFGDRRGIGPLEGQRRGHAEADELRRIDRC